MQTLPTIRENCTPGRLPADRLPERAGLVQWQYAGFPSQRREFDSRIPLSPALSIGQKYGRSRLLLRAKIVRVIAGLHHHSAWEYCGISLYVTVLMIIAVSIPAIALAETEGGGLLSLLIKDTTFQKGITVATEDRTMIVGVPPLLTTNPSSLHVTREAAPPLPPEHKSFASPVFHFAVTDNTNMAAQLPATMRRPLVIVLQPTVTGPFAQRIAVWDTQKNRWVRYTTSRQNNGALRASVKRADFLVTVVQEDNIVLGKGSWFRSRHSDAAASNDFPMGTKLRITNLENKKSTIVTVRSTGPFVKGRVVDISRQAFKQLASLGSGILHTLRVERLQ